MDVAAVVVVGGRASPVDALTEVGGVPMVALAVRALLSTGLVDHVHLHDLGARSAALERACSALPVSVRSGSGWTVAEPAGVVVLHDAARPLAPATVATAVVDAVRNGHGMAVPVLPLPDTVKHVDDEGVVRATPDRAALRVLQTPVAARPDLLGAVATADPLEQVRRHLAAGGVVHTVEGDPAAFAVRSAWDLELAELLARLPAERTIVP